MGLAISPDGTLLAVTSQGREGNGGNALNLVKVISPYYPVELPAMEDRAENLIVEKSESPQKTVSQLDSQKKESGIADILSNRTVLWSAGILLILTTVLLIYSIVRKRRSNAKNQ